MRATETEGNGGSNKEHEVKRKDVVVGVHLHPDVFICMRISVRRVFVRECMRHHHHHKRGRRRESGNACGRQKRRERVKRGRKQRRVSKVPLYCE